MRASISTEVVVVGDAASEVLRGLDALPNVTAVSLSDDADASVPSAATTYLLHDRDPLEHVASAWTEFFDDRATSGTLDVEIEQALSALDRGASRLPDYYAVLDPESLAGTRRHWWLGVLPSIAPLRVLPVAPRAREVRRLLAALPTSHAWPEPRSWLADLAFRVPDGLRLDPR